MLQIKAPLQTVLKADFIQTGEGFCRKILGNYDQLTEMVDSEDLMHVVTQPPEVFLIGGGGSSLVSETQVRNQQIQKVRVINNIVNRILVAADGRLTYQDSTYISSSLHKLGIHDDKRFLEQVFNLTRETKETNQLIHAYQDNREQLLSLLSQYRSEHREQLADIEVQQHSEILHLHEEISRRWKAGDVYRVQQQFALSPEGGTVITQESYQLAEQGLMERALVLQQLREEIRGEAVPLVYHHDNVYESEHVSESVLSEERLKEQVTSAVLLSMVDNIYRSAYEQVDHRTENWYRIDSALYGAGDNTLMRMVNNTAYLQYLHEQEVHREQTNLQLSNELSLIEQMTAVSQEAIQLYYRNEGDVYPAGDEYRTSIEGGRTDVTRTSIEGDRTLVTNLREGDENVTMTHPREGDTTYVDAAVRRQIESYRAGDEYRTSVEGGHTDVTRTSIEGDRTLVTNLREGDENVTMVHPREGDTTYVDATVRRQIESYRAGDEYRTSIEGGRTDVTRTSIEGDRTLVTNLREGDESVTMVHPREGDTTYIDASSREESARYSTQNVSVTRQGDRTSRQLQEYIDRRISMEGGRIGETRGEGGGTMGRAFESGQAAAGETSIGTGAQLPLTPEEAGDIPMVHPGEREEAPSPSVAVDERNTLEQQIYQINRQNVLRQTQYLKNLQNLVREYHEQGPQGTPQERLREDMRMALEHPEQMMESIRREEERGRRYREAAVEETYRMMPPEQRQVFELVQRYLDEPQLFGDRPVVTPNGETLFHYDLARAGMETPLRAKEGGEAVMLPAEQQQRILIEEIMQQPPEVHREEAPAMESVYLSHRQVEQTLDEETIEQLRQEMRRLEEQTTKVTEKVEENHRIERREVHNEDREIITETNTDRISEIVGQSIRGQLDEISERIYGRLERQLHNERRRRGL